MIKVKKRDGSIQEFDIDKIREQIIPATKNTNINPLEFESQVFIETNQIINTSDIDDSLILTAKNNVSDLEPDWDIVAGRLMARKTQREIYKNTKFDYKDFLSHIKSLIKQHYYRNDITKWYSDEQINELGEYIKPDRDYNLRLSQIALLKSKYLVKNKKGTLEYPSTADMVNSMILASIEDEMKKVVISKEYYDELSEYRISLATPFKANLRIPNGNTGSCYIGETDDNTPSIFKSYTDMAYISQEGGGIGWYLGKIRPGDTYSDKVPKANVINKWIKIINDIAVAVNQRGIRKGAITPALDWWHLDIKSFVEIKSELEGDLRDKCFDIFPQVVLDNYFVDKALAKEDVYLFNQYEYKKLTGVDITELIDEQLYQVHIDVEKLIEQGKLKHYEKVNAYELFGKFLWHWIEYGDFYITHKDMLNYSNYLTEFGIAKCGNLCVESFSLSKVGGYFKREFKGEKEITTETDNFYHSCNLISINIANILNDDEMLKNTCRIAVRMLDASIDLSTFPVLEAEKTSKFLRNIGIGVVGMSDYMAYNKVLYDTEEGILLGEKIIEKIAYYCYKASIELSIEKGAYPGFAQANYSKLFGKDPKELNSLSPNGFDWVELQQDIIKYGIRNFYLIAIAPNTSSGLCQGVGASYLPAHNKNNTQKLADLIVPVLPKFIKDRFWFYKTKFQYKTEDIIKFTRRIQRWVDTGISMELTINPELSPDISLIGNEILQGFKTKELKAVYYSITIGRDNNKCESCAN